MNKMDFYLASANAYANQATKIFNMFITVMFSSFAFARALPLKHLGHKFDIVIFTLSTSSIFIGGSLLSFYIISFISFNELSKKAELLINQIHAEIIKSNFPPDVTLAFTLSRINVFGLSLPSLGFVIGAFIAFITFMWLTNY